MTQAATKSFWTVKAMVVVVVFVILVVLLLVKLITFWEKGGKVANRDGIEQRLIFVTAFRYK